VQAVKDKIKQNMIKIQAISGSLLLKDHFSNLMYCLTNLIYQELFIIIYQKFNNV